MISTEDSHADEVEVLAPEDEEVEDIFLAESEPEDPSRFVSYNSSETDDVHHIAAAKRPEQHWAKIHFSKSLIYS